MQIGEHRVVDPKTGGEKGSKLARFDLIPIDALWALAEHYGRNTVKYEDDNWKKGYAWSLSYAALLRHLSLWWNGEEIDVAVVKDRKTGRKRILRSHHLIAVAWHAIALWWYQRHGVGTDDRPKTDSIPITWLSGGGYPE